MNTTELEDTRGYIPAVPQPMKNEQAVSAPVKMFPNLFVPGG